MNNQPIGVLDSGVGGLSIWKEIVRELPKESTIYIADSKNCPYGNKSEKHVYRLARRLVQFLLNKQCKLVVLACNTITVSCLNQLRKDFPNIPIIGTVPVIKTASERSKKRRIGILSTSTTAESKYQKDLIKKFASGCEVINIGTDKLVPFVERGETDSQQLQEILREELLSLVNEHIDTLALGCSHFPFLKDQIQKVLGPNILILDSGAAIARQVKRVLTNNNMLYLQHKATHWFYTTGKADRFVIMLRKLIGYNAGNKIQSVSL